MAWVYAMYKGDKILAIGTTKEICKQMNISKKTFQHYRSNWYLKNKFAKGKNRRTIIRIDKDLDEQ